MADNEEVTVDFDAVDAEVAKGKAAEGKTAANGAADAPTVVIDDDLAAQTDAKTVVTPDEGVQKLKKQLDDERTARIAAENRAREASNAEAAARGDVQKSHLEQIQGAIEKATQTKAILKAKYAESAAAGDWVAAAEVQSEMAYNAADIRQLKAGEYALKNAPPPKVSDPVEEYCKSLSPAAAAWVRNHAEYVTDAKKQKLMLSAHYKAEGNGFALDSPEYFKFIEGELKASTVSPAARLPDYHDDPPTEPTAEAAARATGGRSTAPAAAPVTRSGNGAGERPGTVRLGPQQREMARNLFPDAKDPDKEYAKNMTAEERKRGPV